MPRPSAPEMTPEQQTYQRRRGTRAMEREDQTGPELWEEREEARRRANNPNPFRDEGGETGRASTQGQGGTGGSLPGWGPRYSPGMPGMPRNGPSMSPGAWGPAPWPPTHWVPGHWWRPMAPPAYPTWQQGG